MSVHSATDYISFDASTLQIRYTSQKPKQSAIEMLSQIKTATETSSISDQLADELLGAAAHIYTRYCKKYAFLEKQGNGTYYPVKAKNFSMGSDLSTVSSLYARIRLRVNGSDFFPVPPEMLIHIFQFVSIKDIASCSRITRCAFSKMRVVWEDRAEFFRVNRYITEKNPVRQLQTQFESIRELYQRKLLPDAWIVAKEKYVFKTIFAVEKTVLNMLRYINSAYDYIASIFFHSDKNRVDVSVWPHLFNCGASPLIVCCNTGDTLLHQAILYPCDPDLIARLVACGLDPNHQNFQGNTPVHTAAQFGTLEHLRCLAQYGGNLMAVNKEGSTPLHLAIQRAREKKVITWLLKKQDFVNAQDAKGNTVLHYAAKFVYLSAVENIYSSEPYFQVDVSAWVVEVAKALLTKGANPAIYNVKRKQPRDYTYEEIPGEFIYHSVRVQEFRALLSSFSTSSNEDLFRVIKGIKKITIH
jgi:hypothetical protein